MPLRARDLMHADPLTVAASMPLLEVQHLFAAAEISSAPVLDEGGRVIGMISSNDLLRANDQAADDEIDEGELDDETRADGLARLTARDVANPYVRWVTPDMSARQIAALMRAEGLHRVLVGADGKLAGILTTFDLLRVIAR